MSKKNDKIHYQVEELEAIIAALPEHIYWEDIDCVIQGCNDQQAQSAGFLSRYDLVGKTDYDMPWASKADDIIKSNKEVMLSRKTITSEEQTVVDGRVRFYQSTKSPRYDKKGNVIGLLGVSIDITEKKEAEELAEAANKIKTEFIQNMQHDIRTPSSGVWSVLDLLSKKERDAQKKEVLTMVANSSKQLLDLCNDVVDFGHLEAGNEHNITAQIFDIRELIHNVMDLNKPAAFSKNLRLNIKVSGEVPPNIKSDDYRFRRILVNLLGNAVKFTDSGVVSIDVSIKINDKRHAALHIAVKDSGIGIEPKGLDSIFGKFTRLIPSNTGKYPGTGLGLYMVKKYVEDLEGDIKVRSTVGEGSVFSIDIPIIIPVMDSGERGLEIDEDYHSPLNDYERNDEEPQGVSVTILDNSKLREKKRLQSMFKHKILIIEDNEVAMFSAEQIISNFTPNIDGAVDMRKALELLERNQYDLIISDLGLPDGSGEEIAATIKTNTKSPNHKTPFIAVTAHHDKERHKAALNAGFAETTTKPLTTERMEELLKSYPARGTTLPVDELSDLAVIDIELTMERLRTKDLEKAAFALKLLSGSLKEDMPTLQQAQELNDIMGVREVLHKIRGGLCYSGTPRLEKAIIDLHTAVKLVDDLKKVEDKFDMAYEQVRLFEENYQEMIK